MKTLIKTQGDTDFACFYPSVCLPSSTLTHHSSSVLRPSIIHPSIHHSSIIHPSLMHPSASHRSSSVIPFIHLSLIQPASNNPFILISHYLPLNQLPIWDQSPTHPSLFLLSIFGVPNTCMSPGQKQNGIPNNSTHTQNLSPKYHSVDLISSEQKFQP